MKQRRLGRDGPLVSAVGLGCMGMSDYYGPADERESLATIAAALDAGVTLLDTGDFYGMGHNELLIREALRGRPRESVQISVKFGPMRDPDGASLGYDARPAAVKTSLAYTLKRLGTDYIDIYRPARLDPAVPIEDTIGAIGEMVRAGYVRFVGLSEVGAATLQRAASVHAIVDLQIEYSLLSRSIETAILPACRRLGIGVTAYGILSRGLLSGRWSADRRLTAGDFRGRGPRFQTGNVEQNLALVERLRAVAATMDTTVSQLAVAWVASRGEDVIPLIGARRRDQLTDALTALRITLTPEQRAAIEAAVPAGAAAGARYDPHQMALLDSEKMAATT